MHYGLPPSAASHRPHRGPWASLRGVPLRGISLRGISLGGISLGGVSLRWVAAPPFRRVTLAATLAMATIACGPAVVDAQQIGAPARGTAPPDWFLDSLGNPAAPSAIQSGLAPPATAVGRRIDLDRLLAAEALQDPAAPPWLGERASEQIAAMREIRPLAKPQLQEGTPEPAREPAPMVAAMQRAELGFAPTPTLVQAHWPAAESAEMVYNDRYPVPTQRPWIEWGRPYYAAGMIAPGGTLFGPNNLLQPAFYLYGDFRTGVGVGRNEAEHFANVAARLNLDMDLQLTSTERFHGFIGPMNNANQFTQVSFEDGQVVWDPVLNPNLVTGFFEGDLGYMLGGITENPADFDLPIAAGLMPLTYQNGIWMEDAASGVAISRNALHSRALNWANFDASAFALFDQINSPAFGTDEHAAQAFGTAWFIDAYGGYIETGYAFVHDRKDQGRSYHNATLAFTRRYFDRIGNSIRVIVNSGQALPEAERTADGGLLIFENNLITAHSLTVVPYMNLFYGWGRPQSVARNVLAGGVLRNIGINFETDGLNGYPTLDASGNNTAGGALGVNLLGASIDRQLVLETAYLHANGSAAGRIAKGDQWGLGARYQFPLSNCTLLRFDTMYGWRDDDRDLYGGRAEFRYKF